jgi:uncharacterized protein (DUF1778 family)
MATSSSTEPPKAERRAARLEARMPPRVHALVKHAAHLRGRSVTEFVVTAAEEAAKRTIEEEAVFRVSVEDQRRLLDALSKPARPTAALRKAYKLSNKLIAPE